MNIVEKFENIYIARKRSSLKRIEIIQVSFFNKRLIFLQYFVLTLKHRYIQNTVRYRYVPFVDNEGKYIDFI